MFQHNIKSYKKDSSLFGDIYDEMGKVIIGLDNALPYWHQ